MSVYFIINTEYKNIGKPQNDYPLEDYCSVYTVQDARGQDDI